MSLTCPECGVTGVNCVCAVINKAKKESNMNCNKNNRVYPHKGMTPVEVDNPIDRKWRQLRDEANKDIALRKALIEYDETIHTRAKQIELEAVTMMTLGGLHPNTIDCMSND